MDFNYCAVIFAEIDYPVKSFYLIEIREDLNAAKCDLILIEDSAKDSDVVSLYFW